MKQTWYYAEGSKKAELWTILHLPYTFMALSFLVVGFSISKPVNYTVLVVALIAYFFGLTAAHAFDQLPGMGSTYVKYLTKKELLTLGSISTVIALSLGVWFIIGWQALWMLPLMIIQASFVILYPMSTLFKGFFHTDFWFAVGFGAMPVAVGFYANNLSFSWLILPFGAICFLISAIEINLSRFVRKQRAEGANDVLIERPERALKLLCFLSYVFGITMLVC